jgi:hypothetical protein
MSSESIYLVQRLTRKDRDYKSGFDAMFELDYMGSSEFENGSVFQSLTRMRNPEALQPVGRKFSISKKVTVPVTVSIEQVDINFDDRLTPMWVVGGPEERLYFAERLEAFLKADRWQENPRIIAALRSGRVDEDRYLPDAWWDLGADVMFTDIKTIADDLLSGVTG